MAFLAGPTVGGFFGIRLVLAEATRPSVGSLAVPPKKSKEKTC